MLQASKAPPVLVGGERQDLRSILLEMEKNDPESFLAHLADFVTTCPKPGKRGQRRIQYNFASIAKMATQGTRKESQAVTW